MNAICSYLRLPMALGLAGLLMSQLCLRAADEVRKEVPQNEQLKFEQDKALANMRELEERMFRLAELIRSLRPEDSARLLMGVQRAREHLIADRMQEASKLLASLKLDKAADEQTVIIAKLEELKKLLLTTDLDLEIKLEQLRKIQNALGKLNALIGKETQQNSGTEALADGEKPFDPQNLSALESGEQRNRKAGEQLAELSRQVGPAAAKATASLGNASEAMGQAAGQLGKAQPGAAGKKQKRALAELNDAKGQLAQLQQQLREEVEGAVRQRVMNQLKDMLAQQGQVRGATEKLVPRVTEGNLQAVLATKRLSPAEDRISEVGRKSRELVELTQFSMVLPVALGALNSQIDFVSNDLGAGKANEGVVGDEKDIESSLQALIDAMEDASKSSDEQGQGQCKGCKGDRNKLLAEVKMLRWMQSSLNTETKKADQLKQSNEITEVALLRRSRELETRQSDIRSIASQLHAKTCDQCVKGIH